MACQSPTSSPSVLSVQYSCRHRRGNSLSKQSCGPSVGAVRPTTTWLESKTVVVTITSPASAVPITCRAIAIGNKDVTQHRSRLALLNLHRLQPPGMLPCHRSESWLCCPRPSMGGLSDCKNRRALDKLCQLRLRWDPSLSGHHNLAAALRLRRCHTQSASTYWILDADITEAKAGRCCAQEEAGK